MSENKTLKSVDRQIFRSYFEDGLLDIGLAAFLLMMVLGPFLSVPLGDFWAAAVFLPFYGVVYLVLRTVSKRLVVPRIGRVAWGEMRRRKLRRGALVLFVINVIFLGLGLVSFLMPLASGYAMSIRFSVMMLILFTAAGTMLDFPILYLYGVLIALAVPGGEWLYQNAGVSHHGYPVAFGALCLLMLARGLFKLITLVRDNPIEMEEGAVQELNHG